VLDLSKLEENKMTLETREFSVREVVEEALELISFQAEKKGLEISYRMEQPELYHITMYSDATRLCQILVNLLSNAVKFSSKGEVSVEVSRRHPVNNKHDSSDPNCNRMIWFSVTDEGIGISDTVKTTLFAPFQQADSSIARKFVSKMMMMMMMRMVALTFLLFIREELDLDCRSLNDLRISWVGLWNWTPLR